jgi:hypothetical protein
MMIQLMSLGTGHPTLSFSLLPCSQNQNRLQIRVKGSQIPKPVPSFSEMNIASEIKPVILRNIEASDWKEPTPIQMQAIPILLANRDILASAPTGLSSILSISLSLGLSVSLPHRLSRPQALERLLPLSSLFSPNFNKLVRSESEL